MDQKVAYQRKIVEEGIGFRMLCKILILVCFITVQVIMINSLFESDSIVDTKNRSSKFSSNTRQMHNK